MENRQPGSDRAAGSTGTEAGSEYVGQHEHALQSGHVTHALRGHRGLHATSVPVLLSAFHRHSDDGSVRLAPFLPRGPCATARPRTGAGWHLPETGSFDIISIFSSCVSVLWTSAIAAVGLHAGPIPVPWNGTSGRESSARRAASRFLSFPCRRRFSGPPACPAVSRSSDSMN